MILSIYQRFTSRISEKLPILVLLLCIVQPLLDVASYFVNLTQTAMSFIAAVRLLLLCIIVLLGFILAERKWVYWCMFGVLALFTGGHVLACVSTGYKAPFEDFANLIRIYQLPLMTLSFITYLRRCPNCLESVKKGFLLCLTLIILVELLSVITGTNPYTYPTKSLGIMGWFYNGSAQSAILSILVPVAIVCVLEKWNCHPAAAAVIGLLTFGTLYFFATRLSYGAILGTAAAMAVTMVILKKTQKTKSLRAAGVFFLCFVVTIGLYAVSPAVKNTDAVTANLLWKQEQIDQCVEADDGAAEAEGLEDLERKTASLRSAYEAYLPGLVERFGIARVAQQYDYTTDARVLANARLEKLNYCRMLFADSGTLTRLFGAELAQMHAGGENHDVENDFHGIYYLCGGVGLCLMVLFFGLFFVRIALSLIRNFSKAYTLTAAGFGVALITALVHAYFTAGVLRRPNVTFYLAAVLAVIYALTRETIKKAGSTDVPCDTRKDDKT